MRKPIITYLSRSPITVILMMTISFLGFGYFSVNLFLLFKANIDLINQFGVLAIMEGAAWQLLTIIFHAIVSVLFYAIWKLGERLIVDWLACRPLGD